MGYVTLLRFTARLGAIASALGCAATVVAAPPAVAEPGCSDIEVVFARGTNDAPNLGNVGQAFADALRSQVGGQTVTTYAVNYPASFDFLTSADGAADATNHIANLVSQCPSTRIVLGGYSQGAAVVDMLGGIPPLGNKLGGEIAPALPSNLAQSVAAVAVFGNPSAKFSVPITNSQFGGRAIDICKDGDPICSDGRNPFAHSDYVSSGLAQQGASFVAGLV
ncbi:cutinase family protein [Mycolicibacterium arenosum]|uniref:Cutinase n=1 Tax=Mycolicibacterium arenosum TaxID=2952157 RepID=A0ABT1M8H5_9MYCO|nr:cutinase family protein [Mycolicibacterium sp. CAU 1645]MCP9275463.1 cutinase family protein [Mycolicibacterium sp. CAU 1645]